jgi:hypothetical protein
MAAIDGSTSVRTASAGAEHVEQRSHPGSETAVVHKQTDTMSRTVSDVVVSATCQAPANRLTWLT